MIYLDNAATTKPSASVIEKTMQYLKDDFGNAGSIYSLGTKAKKAIDEARESVAELIGAKPEQIIFTSGGTEANNLAIFGVQDYLRKIGRTHIITSMGEHDSVFKAVKKLSTKAQFHTRFLPLNSKGSIENGNLVSELLPETGLVSVMCVNNEVGAVNRIDLIADECKKRGVLFHTDCVQALGTVKLRVDEIPVDMMSLSSHKIHGLKGTGALFVRNPALLEPRIIGGSAQEYGLRGGTENVAGIVAFGQACRDIIQTSKDTQFKIRKCKSTFLDELTKRLHDNGCFDLFNDNAMSGCNDSKILSLRFNGVDAETLILLLANKDVFVSAGSACHSHESVPSRVLCSIGLKPEEARNTIRVSFSGDEEKSQIRYAAAYLALCVLVLSTSVS